MLNALEVKVNAKSHNAKVSLKKIISEVMINIDKEESKHSCGRFQFRLEEVVKVGGDCIKQFQ